MGHKIINLDDAKNTATITVEGREFIISRIVMKARQLYGEYMIRSGKYMQRVHEIQEAVKSAQGIDMVKKIDDDLGDLAEEYAMDKADFLDQIMEIILSKNGYTFDKDWWEQNTDYHIMEKFCVECLQKDQEETPSRGKKGAL